MDKKDDIDKRRQDWSMNRSVPENELELQFLSMNPQWGEQEGISPALQDIMQKPIVRTITKGRLYYDEDTKKVSVAENDKKLVVYERLWEQLDFLTRDLRVANIDGEEYKYCSHMLDLAMDCIREGYVEAAQMSMQRAAVRLELSQSKKGFLRKMMQTIIRQSSERRRDESNNQFLRKFGNNRER